MSIVFSYFWWYFRSLRVIMDNGWLLAIKISFVICSIKGYPSNVLYKCLLIKIELSADIEV